MHATGAGGAAGEGGSRASATVPQEPPPRRERLGILLPGCAGFFCFGGAGQGSVLGLLG
jgi:hypothetical protein